MQNYLVKINDQIIWKTAYYKIKECFPNYCIDMDQSHINNSYSITTYFMDLPIISFRNVYYDSFGLSDKIKINIKTEKDIDDFIFKIHSTKYWKNLKISKPDKYDIKNTYRINKTITNFHL